MLADRLLVRTFEQAVHLAVGIVEQLDLPNAKLVRHSVARSLRYLVDGLLRKLKVIVVIHEPWHVDPPQLQMPRTATVSPLVGRVHRFGVSCGVADPNARF